MQEEVKKVEPVRFINPVDWAAMPDEDWDDGPWDDNVRWV